MSTREIVINVHEEGIRRIGVLFGDDITTQEGSEDFFNLAIVTLIAMGEEMKKGRIIVAMNPKAVGGFKGVTFKFPKPKPMCIIK